MAMGFLIISITLWYLIGVSPSLSSAIHKYPDPTFQLIYQSIFFVAIPAVLFTILQKILEKLSSYTVFTLVVIASWVNLILFILNPENIYKWYNKLSNNGKN